MSKTSIREKILMTTAVVLGLIYLYYRFYLIPIINRGHYLHLNIEKYKEQERLFNFGRMSKDNEKTLLDNVKIKYDCALKAVPDNEKNAEIAFDIKNYAEANNAALSSLYIDEPYLLNNNNNKEDKECNLFVVPVKVTLLGNMNSIGSFIYSVENNDRFAEISDISLNENSQKLYHSSIVIKYYYNSLAKGDRINGAKTNNN